MSVEFGEKLRKRRLELGLTLDQLAEKIGSRKAYVWQLENKKPAKPSGELLLKIANVLDIAAEFLIDDSVEVPTGKHVEIALARGARNRNLTQADLDKLFKISDAGADGEIAKGSK
ncbi:helix-turn-helix transcriptional regulator [Nitratireductor rhodophyticola]|uniref:helix-turn-helix domain-containing protein n=1 Tax=Nitratireductor rhodophyticola TaxID=2854036 RepID=UPI003008D3D7